MFGVRLVQLCGVYWSVAVCLFFFFVVSWQMILILERSPLLVLGTCPSTQPFDVLCVVGKYSKCYDDVLTSF